MKTESKFLQARAIAKKAGFYTLAEVNRKTGIKVSDLIKDTYLIPKKAQ